jgi:hypothetical protein
MRQPMDEWRQSSIIEGRGRPMAQVRKGQLARPPEWWRHLRWSKRLFWKRERHPVQKAVRQELAKRRPSIETGEGDD